MAPPPPPPTPPQPLDMRPDRPKGTAAALLIGVGILVIAAIVVAVMSIFFHRADVSVTPHRYTAHVEGSFETSASDAVLPHQRVSADDTKTKSVTASGSKHVENRASGTITVYNGYSAKSERLITNTRFETKDGKVYRVHTPVTVPGYTTKNGAKVPGSVDVTVYADEAGEKYNIGIEDFTIPGLKGSAQFESMYAKSKTPMAGGFVGEQAVVDATLRAQTVTDLKAELDRSLRDKLLTTAPEGVLIFPDTVSVIYAEGTDTIDGENAVISVSGTASAPGFPAQQFAAVMATAAGVTAEGPLTVENPNALSVRLTTPDAIGGDAPFSITVSGDAALVSVIDTAQLANDLAGKNKANVNTVLAGYPGIADILVNVYPFWRSDIPEKADKVSVVIQGMPEERAAE